MNDLPVYIKPRCFPTQKLFNEWKDCARIANDPCTICEDCTPRYQHLMKIAKRCDVLVWKDYKFGER